MKKKCPKVGFTLICTDFMDIDEFEGYEEGEEEFSSRNSADQSQISVVQRSFTYQTKTNGEQAEEI